MLGRSFGIVEVGFLTTGVGLFSKVLIWGGGGALGSPFRLGHHSHSVSLKLDKLLDVYLRAKS